MQKATVGRASSAVACCGVAPPHQHHLRTYRCQRFHFCHSFFEIRTASTVFNGRSTARGGHSLALQQPRSRLTLVSHAQAARPPHQPTALVSYRPARTPPGVCAPGVASSNSKRLWRTTDPSASHFHGKRLRAVLISFPCPGTYSDAIFAFYAKNRSSGAFRSKSEKADVL